MHYTRVQKPDHKFTLKPLVAMGVGLQLDLNEMEEVLALAGLSFNPTDYNEQAYRYLQACRVSRLMSVMIFLWN